MREASWNNKDTPNQRRKCLVSRDRSIIRTLFNTNLVEAVIRLRPENRKVCPTGALSNCIEKCPQQMTPKPTRNSNRTQATSNPRRKMGVADMAKTLRSLRSFNLYSTDASFEDVR
jgi:hypothetical protein